MNDRMLCLVEEWSLTRYDQILGRIRRVDAAYHPGIWDEAQRLERGWKREAVHNKNLMFKPYSFQKRFFESCRLLQHRTLAADLATALVAKSIWEAWNDGT